MANMLADAVAIAESPPEAESFINLAQLRSAAISINLSNSDLQEMPEEQKVVCTDTRSPRLGIEDP